jgi:hypothetical protein
MQAIQNLPSILTLEESADYLRLLILCCKRRSQVKSLDSRLVTIGDSWLYRDFKEVARRETLKAL